MQKIDLVGHTTIFFSTTNFIFSFINTLEPSLTLSNYVIYAGDIMS